MLGGFIPLLSVLNVALICGQVLISLLTRGGELVSPSAYSKFAAADSNERWKVSSQTGMLIIYTPALLWSSALLSTLCMEDDVGSNNIPMLVEMMLVAHFLKRDLEVILLHNYSGTVELGVCVPIGIFYALTQRLIIYAAGLDPLYYGVHTWIGIAVFAIGQLGNFYHHWILTQLRASSMSNADTVQRRPSLFDTVQRRPSLLTRKASLVNVLLPRTTSSTSLGEGRVYFIPGGGLFEFVTMPHYFFEIIAWLGVFIVASRLNILLVCTGMMSYLSGRAEASTAWYKDKFGDEWPSNRKHLVPFIF